ncbi:MAG: hypothetical protein PHU21_13270, partial [Elusimicrobia bacterium]|nr:hypothetical protein [Elusimicrobiota bacterium]
MARRGSRPGLRRALSALLISALLLAQQGLVLQAYAQTKVEAVAPVSAAGQVGAVGTSLGSAASLSNAGLAAPSGLSLSQPGLGTVPTVIPQGANASASLLAAPAPLAAPAVSPVPAQAATS